MIRITLAVDSGRTGPATRPFGFIFAGPHLLLAISCFLALKSFRMPEPRTVVVYSRKGCHLCEVVKESLSKLSRRGGFTWQVVDVDMDSDLRRQYNDEVPVVFIDGRKAFKYRMDEREFLRRLAS
jgi:glutaredoxin